MTTLETMQDVVRCIEFRQKMGYLAIRIRHVSESDEETLRRAVDVVSELYERYRSIAEFRNVPPSCFTGRELVNAVISGVERKKEGP